MNPKRKAVAVAVAGTALGAAGLGVLAMPAGAADEPVLPPIGAQALVESTLNADLPAMSGEVEVTNNLGLPSLPGVEALNVDGARVFHDGNDKARIGIQQGNSEQTIVHDGNTVWQYNAAERTATKLTVPDGKARNHANSQTPDPATLATELVREMREFSTVTVDGTARVAERPAYELVLTPKPDERTVLREVRVAIDSETRLPLQLSVMTHGTTEPAAEVGFSEIEFAPQPANLFRFTPPAGTEVTEHKADEARKQGEKAQQRAENSGKVVGEGWDTVLVTRMPSDLAGMNRGDVSGEQGAEGTDPRALLEQAGKRVSGSWGSGYVITTKVGSALVADDGRIAFGAVPQQVLTQALGSA